MKNETYLNVSLSSVPIKKDKRSLSLAKYSEYQAHRERGREGESAGAFHRGPVGLRKRGEGGIIVFEKCLSTMVNKINSVQQCITVYLEFFI